MDNKDRNSELNPFEEQMEEIRDWQDNAYNPGHYIGTGRVTPAVRGLSKYPVIMLIAGILFLIPTVISLKNGFSFENLFTQVIPLIIGCGLVYGGVARLSKKPKS